MAHCKRQYWLAVAYFNKSSPVKGTLDFSSLLVAFIKEFSADFLFAKRHRAPPIYGCFQPGATVFSVLYTGWTSPISDAPVSSFSDDLHALIFEVSFLQRQPTRASWHGGAFPSELGSFSSYGLPELLLLIYIYIFCFFSSDFLH